MITVSPSALDSFQYYLDSELCAYEFLRRVCKLDPTGIEATAGNAFHRFIETGAVPSQPISYDGCSWHFIDACSDAIVLPEPVLREARIDRVFEPHGIEPFHMKGKLDGISGSRADEYKTTKKIDLEKWLGSWQWRAYMAIDPTIERVDHHVFKVKISQWTLESDPDQRAYRVEYQDYKKLPCTRYEAVERDTLAFCREYMRFLLDCEKRNLIRCVYRSTKRSNWQAWEPGDKFESINPDPKEQN